MFTYDQVVSPNGKLAHSSWKTHMSAARMAYDRGLYVAAARNYDAALQAAEETDLTEEETAHNLLGLALCYCEQGNYSKAEHLYKRVLDIDETHLTTSARHVELADSLHDLAVLYKKEGRLHEAESLAHRALVILQANDCAEADLVASTLKDLAQICRDQGQLAPAKDYINQAFAILDTNSHRHTKTFAEILMTMGAIAARESRYSEARQFVEQALQIFEVATGGTHPELADFMESAAGILEQKCSTEKGDTLLQRAQTIRRHLKEIDH